MDTTQVEHRTLSAVPSGPAAVAAPPERPPTLLPTQAPLQATNDVVSGVAVVTLRGRIDRTAVRTLQSALHAALRVRSTTVVLDLHDTSLEETDGPHLLMSMRTLAARHGASLVLASVPTAAGLAIRWGGKATAVPMLPSVADAVYAARRPR